MMTLAVCMRLILLLWTGRYTGDVSDFKLVYSVYMFSCLMCK